MNRPTKFSKRVRQLITHALAIVVGVLIAAGAYRVSPSQASPASEVAASPPRPEDTLLSQRQPLPAENRFVAAAVERVGSAVVRIDTERTVAQPNPFAPFSEDPLFRRFFGDEAVPNVPPERRLRGQGSGFIIDSSGVILTNAHVVNQADRVTVNLKDGRTFAGQVMGTDPVTDLAVVKIEGRDLPTALLGDSESIRVGDWAIAVGNPLGLDNTVTLGIVSTLDRPSSKVGIPDKRIDFIQTDAAINPGNSGGPLLNDRGEVIGINTAIRADANGIGFAIPINQAKTIYPKLARGEQVAHPYIGVQILTLTPDLAAENNRDPNAVVQLPEIDGVLIARVQPNTPAAAAGLRRGDIVTAIDGQRVTSADQLQRLVDNSRVGQRLEVTVRRGNQTLTLSVRPGDLQEFS